ncbi:hypothetical protein HBI15_088950 [Parastagonospora nodorum]|nr:hypothetical protein HBI15_088950 [Parastagonospora nodorum]
MAALESCSLPFHFSDVPIAQEETSIFIKCHDQMFSKVTVVDDRGQELFVGGGEGLMKSWSWRRQIKDTAGLPLFDLRHHGWAMKNLWTVESPDGGQMAELRHVSDARRSDLDMFLKGKEGGEDVVLNVRQKDHSAITTQVYFGDRCVAELLLQESNDITDLSCVDRSSWRVRIAGGVDPAVILVIALCRAEMHHIWRQ